MWQKMFGRTPAEQTSEIAETRMGVLVVVAVLPEQPASAAVYERGNPQIIINRTSHPLVWGVNELAVPVGIHRCELSVLVDPLRFSNTRESITVTEDAATRLTYTPAKTPGKPGTIQIG
jgi:hypothetical protein